ncbi:MAG: hypothetical protein DMF93_11000 [Acidobacteria bacterium]|nr:MAG: hypothetical protein DMF93_11000 [Acidobacteriota bacterium]
MRGAVALLIAGALSARAAIGGEPPADQSPAPSARLVTIDLVATDARGRTVENLTAADFDLREAGAPLALESVRFVRAVPAARPAPVPVLTAADERQAAARDAARLFAIFLDEYHVKAGANADRVRDALLQFVDRDLSPDDLIVVMKPLDSLLAIRSARDRDAARAAIESFSGRRGDYEPRNAYERDYIAGTPARIDAVRNQVALSAINALALHLGALSDRRKTLIVASEGVGRADRGRGQEYLPTLDTIVRSANRANVAVYAFDPRDAADAAAPDDALRRLADDTDGQAAISDADAMLRRASADSSAYYLLSFRAPHPDDGRFRELEARVKRSPRKVVPPEPAPHASPLIRPWFGMARGRDGSTRVTFVWEPAVRVPGDRTRRVPARLVLTAKTSDGTVVFEGPVAPTGPAAMDAPGATPPRAIFEVRPGRLRLRMSIEDAASQALDQDVRDISVRDLRGEVAVGTPEVLRARNAREFRALEADAAAPVASREFSRTERLLIRFQAYGSSSAPPQVSARLLGRSGYAIRDLAVTPSATPGDQAIDLPLASLATGEYVVEVTARRGARDASDRFTFRVTS